MPLFIHCGCGCTGIPGHTVVWDDINLQDAVELSNARLLEARAKQIEQELEPEREPEAPLEGGTQ